MIVSIVAERKFVDRRCCYNSTHLSGKSFIFNLFNRCFQILSTVRSITFTCKQNSARIRYMAQYRRVLMATVLVFASSCLNITSTLFAPCQSTVNKEIIGIASKLQRRTGEQGSWPKLKDVGGRLVLEG